MRNWTAETTEDGRFSNRGSGGFFGDAGPSVVPLRLRRDINESPFKPGGGLLGSPPKPFEEPRGIAPCHRSIAPDEITRAGRRLFDGLRPPEEQRSFPSSLPHSSEGRSSGWERGAQATGKLFRAGLDHTFPPVGLEKAASKLWTGSEEDLAHTVGSMSFHGEMEDEEGDVPPQRLSRHIPLRDGMNYPLAAFHLTQHAPLNISPTLSDASRTNTPPPHQGVPPSTIPASQLLYGSAGSSGLQFVGGPVGSPLLSHTATASSSLYGSFTDSIISDDSTYMASLYSEKLAEKLSTDEADPTGPDNSTSSHRSPAGPSRRIRQLGGGEVLQFHPSTRAVSPCPPKQQEPPGGADISSLTDALRRKRSQGDGAAAPRFHRRLSSHPIRVLEAPEFPSGTSQLLDWGCNNKLAIGLENNLYIWNAKNGEGIKLVELQAAAELVERVLWIQRCAYLAVASSAGVTRIYDSAQGKFLRVLGCTTTSPVEKITGLAVHGPMLTASSNAPSGTTRVYDLRIKDALVQTYNGHNGAVSCLTYCPLEPHHLATGSIQGGISIWDKRQSTTPRYDMRHVHAGPVSVLQWDPRHSRRFLSGGVDGVLCRLHLHASRHTVDTDGSPAEEHSPTLQPLTRAHKTGYPITGVAWQPNGDEIVTSHSGKGHLQLRHADTFQFLGSFSAADNEASLSCLTLSPNGEHVCAAQADETLKMWHVFQSSKRVKGQDSTG